MKKILSFLIILIPWFLSSIVSPFNKEFYQTLNLPIYTPNQYVFIFTWIILYILISISIYFTIKDKNINRNYFLPLILTYIFNQLYSIVFFYYNNLFLSAVVTILGFISSVSLIYETYKINKKYAYYLIPFVLWNLFASILITNILFIN